MLSGAIEGLSSELGQALERAAEYLETCPSDPRVSDHDLVAGAASARDLAMDLGSAGGDERLSMVLALLVRLGL